MKILAVGDMHFREIYPYAASFEDRRLDERKEIEDAIVNASSDCDMVVLMGDILDSRNNSAETLKNLTAFVERFGDKKVILMAGNHDSFADGRTALDYLGEIKGKNWIVVTETVHEHMDNGDRYFFVPYLRKTHLDVEDHQGVVDFTFDAMAVQSAKGVFLHHCLSGTKTVSGQLTDLFNEPVYPSERLSKTFQRVFGAHIHLAQDNGNVHVLGSVMNAEVGEDTFKRVIKWDTETDAIESIPLPGRRFYKLVNPTQEDVVKFKAQTIKGLVKVVVDGAAEECEGLAALQGNFETTVVHELPKSDRKRVKEDIDDFSVGNLLKIYSEIKEVPLPELQRGMELIAE